MHPVVNVPSRPTIRNTQECIDKKQLKWTARCDIVRTLGTLLVANYGPNPTKQQVESICKQLILTHPFMRDDIGTGYALWYDKLLERLRNLRKRTKSSGGNSEKIPKTTGKGSKARSSLLKRYTPRAHNVTNDEDTIAKHEDAMLTEMSKKKPREIVILPLLKQTFCTRRDYITSPDRTSVQEILLKYPGLKLLSSDMCEIFSQENGNLKELFFRNWNKYVVGILTYSEENLKIKSRNGLDPTNDYSRESTALKVLAEVLKCKQSLIFVEVENANDCFEIPDDITSSPCLLSLNKSKFCIVIEKIVLYPECSSFAQAVFLLISSYYVFHLSYPDKNKKMLLFLQDYVLERPDNYEQRNGSYLAISADIKNFCV